MPGQPPYGQQPGYGSQPPYGQQPPAFTPPYGGAPRPASYGPEPDGFVQQPQTFPGQQPYGQPGPTPYAQPGPAWSAPGGVPPQAPKKKSGAGIVVGVVAIVLVLIVAGAAALWASQSNSVAKTSIVTTAAPTTSAKATTATKAATKTSTGVGGTLTVSCAGGTIDSSAYTAKVPSGWSCTSASTGLLLSDKKFDTLMVMDIPSTGDAAAACQSLATGGTVTASPDTQWGGKPATTITMSSAGTKVHVRCVAANDTVFYLMAIPITGSYEEVVAGVDALTSGWTWK